MTRVDRVRRAVRGTAQWVSRRPVTEPALPRLALSSWTSALGGGGEVRRRVMITAFRNRTWIEWAVYAACQLRRLGVATTLVYSSSEVRRLYPLARVTGLDQLGFWAGVEAIPGIRLVDLDDWRPRPEETADYREFARDYARTVAAYELRVEENEEGPLRPLYEREVARVEPLLAETAAAFARVLGVNPVARLVCYSGLIGMSSGLCEAARRLGVEVLTVEGWAWRPGHMICNLNAPALEYNIDGWLRAMGAWDSAREDETARLFRFQEGSLGQEEAPPGNLHRVQRQPSSAPLPPAVAAFLERPGPRFLLATNVVGDSSTLRRQPIFCNQRDWVRRTIELFREHPDWNLVVRAHPDEAWVGERVVVRMGEVARSLSERLPNVLVIGGEEDVSSYALMGGLAGGLVWISSIGADMAARGIAVLAAARPKYHALGLVDEPRTVSDYFASLRWLAANRARATPDQRARARQYLDVVFSQFSFDAFSPSYRASDLFLEGPACPPDADVFYRIVAGDLPPETPPRRQARQVA